MPTMSPNRWSCLPAAFAALIGESFDSIIRDIGHDGSEIAWPEMPEPYCRKAFHVQEIINVALTRNYVMMPIEAFPQLATSETQPIVNVFESTFAGKRIERFLDVFDGIALGTMERTKRRHAIAWRHGIPWCPNNGFIDDFAMYIETFWAVIKLL